MPLCTLRSLNGAVMCVPRRSIHTTTNTFHTSIHNHFRAHVHTRMRRDIHTYDTHMHMHTHMHTHTHAHHTHTTHTHTHTHHTIQVPSYMVTHTQTHITHTLHTHLTHTQCTGCGLSPLQPSPAWHMFGLYQNQILSRERGKPQITDTPHTYSIQCTPTYNK